MGFWKNLFGKSDTPQEEWRERAMPEEFREYVRKAIGLIVDPATRSLDGHNLVLHMESSGIPAYEASELVLFIPTAFCRKMLHQVEWPDSYVDLYEGGKEVRQLYSENLRYQVIAEEAETYWEQSPGRDAVLALVCRSSEFQALDKMLHDGGQLENAKVGESVVLR